ncbi:hypothetical protein MYXO_02922 [Myxococcaceae bacterium]|jgi:hypothetical protein|nr:hypothetical protein MYXO_02922 [Myxococcaceae bacterium]
MSVPRPAPLAITRRGLLGMAGVASALGALAQLRAVPARASAPPADQGTSFFSPPENEILTQIVERMVASDDPNAPFVRDTLAIRTIDALCGSLDPSITRPLPTLLRVVEWSPFVFDLRWKRFTELSPTEKDASLEGWMRSRFALRRMAFDALRNLAFLGYYSQDETWPGIGYAGPLIRPGSGAA